MTSFQALPPELRDSICDKLDVDDSMQLLQVSKDLRQHVLTKGPFKKHVESLLINYVLSDKEFLIEINGRCIIPFNAPWELLENMVHSVKEVDVQLEELVFGNGSFSAEDQKFTQNLAAAIDKFSHLSTLRLSAEFPVAKLFMGLLETIISDHLTLDFWGPLDSSDFYETTGYLIPEKELTTIIEKFDKLDPTLIVIICHELDKVYAALRDTSFKMISIKCPSLTSHESFGDFERFLHIGNPGKRPNNTVFFWKRLDEEMMFDPEPFLMCERLPKRKPNEDFDPEEAEFSLLSLMRGSETLVYRRDSFEYQVSPTKRCAFLVSIIYGQYTGYPELFVYVSGLR